MTGALRDADRARFARSGIAPMATADALALLDAALGAGEPALVPVRLDTAALRARAADGSLPPLLRTQVRTPVRTAGAPGPSGDTGRTLADRIAGLAAEEREEVLLDVVRTAVAGVLGHADARSVEVHRGLQDMGFDSLTAVELRNRLGAQAGLRLPTTLAFDYPTAAALAAYLGERLAPKSDRSGFMAAELDRLAAVLAAGATGPEEHAEVGARLTDLLRTWREAGRGDGYGDGDVDLESATDDELFDALDDELGMSSVE